MLIAAGADMYARDTVLGNTLLHMLVLYNRVDMYRYVMEAVRVWGKRGFEYRYSNAQY